MMAYTRMNYVEFKRELGSGIRGAVVDIDKTAVYGRVAEHVGMSFLRKELKAGHYGNFTKGAYGALATVIATKRKGEIAGLKRFVDTLAGTGCAYCSDVYRFCYDYVKSHTFPGFEDLLGYLSSEFGLGAYFITTGMDAAAYTSRLVYENKIKVNGICGNRLLYNDGGMLQGIDIHIQSPYDKYSKVLKMLEDDDELTTPHALPVLAIGDNMQDSVVMNNSRLALASPLAKSAIAEAASLCVPSIEQGGYERFLEVLRKA